MASSIEELERRKQIIKGFLRYSFGEVTEYSGLTEREREICTEDEWKALREWAFEEEG